MADRLAYESRATDNASIDSGLSEPQLDEIALARLSEAEQTVARRSNPMRLRALEQVHASTVERFVNSPGFGVGRLTHLSERWINRRNDASPVPQPAQPSSESYDEPLGKSSQIAREADGLSEVEAGPTPSESDFWDSHVDSISVFLGAEDFGLILDREHVAGFRSHRFWTRPSVDVRPSGEGEPKVEWVLVRLELVSLLKHSEPRVYESENLPRMDELKDAPTRELSLFEREAVGKLRQGNDLMIDEGRNCLQMVGSLRTTEQCLECHRGQRGRLLGAFSYEYARVPPLKELPKAKEPLDLSMRFSIAR